MNIDYEEFVLRLVKNIILVIIITLIIYLTPDDIEKIKKSIFIALIIVFITIIFDNLVPILPQNIKKYINRT
jgi:FtsH-binding integral membrane protein|tara:strand:- start:870 stop:1085 length:216 start_codon:yes stop_codon:yes gene_type:complete